MSFLINFFKKYVLIILVLFTIPTFISIIRPGFFFMQDDLQAFRIHQMDKCLLDYQIPCRWVPDAGYQYGYPQFEYYPPSVYYLGEIIHLLGFQFIDSVKILFALGFITSALAMYLLLNSLFGRWPGFVGALLYTYVPYKAVEVYVRGAMSEFFALSIFPLVFWSSYQFIKLGKLKYLSFFAASCGLLLLTHNLMTAIFIPVVFIWILSLLILERKIKLMPFFIGGGILGFGLAAFFTLPLIFEQEYAHLDTLVGGYFDYRAHFINLKQIFLSNYWGYGSSNIDPQNELNLSTGVLHWILGVLAIALGLLNFKKNRKLSLLIFILALSELGVLFMMHRRSSFIWSQFEFLSFMQFPWRFLSVSIFLLSILGAVNLYLIEKLNISKFNPKKASIFFGIVLIVLVFILHASFFKPKFWVDLSDKDKFSGASWEKQLTISIFDYLPIYAKFPPIQKAPDVPEVLEGKANFLSYKKGSNFQIGEVHVEEEALIRLPLFDFPGMTAYVDGKKVNHVNNDCRNQEFCLGLITFSLSEGRHIIEARLKNTPVRTIGNTLTLVSILIVGLFFILNGKKFFS